MAREGAALSPHIGNSCGFSRTADLDVGSLNSNDRRLDAADSGKMIIQTLGAIKRARPSPPLGREPKPMAHASGFNIPIEELRRLVADMVD
jgi:hypothetical protein